MSDIILTPESVHYAKEIDDKGNFVKWVPAPNPEGVRKQSTKYGKTQIIKFHNFEKYFCFFCGRTQEKLGYNETLTIDHIDPIRESNRDELENLQILCSACHKLRHWAELYTNKHLEKFWSVKK